MELPSLFELEPPRASLKKKLAKVYAMICLIFFLPGFSNSKYGSNVSAKKIREY